MQFGSFVRVGAGLALLLAALAVGGCAAPGVPVVAERSGEAGSRSRSERPREATRLRGATYRVKRGDTLYAIGRRAGVSVAALARLNGLRPPYRIYPGMKLRLRGRAVAARQPARKPSPSRAATPSKPKERRAATSQAGGLTWRWPTSSPVVKEYGGVNKGLDFRVPSGAKIGSAGDGEVVYAGTGLAGYESLAIVRHNAQYLSAYSVNQPLAVKEGQRIKAGQTIAAVTGSSRTAGALHFEIRRNGEPISPRSVLR